MTIVHIASNTVVMEGRYLRQRCVWCGELLHDVDMNTVQVCNTSDAQDDELYPTWGTGRLVAVDGNHSYIVEGNKIPENCCYDVDAILR